MNIPNLPTRVGVACVVRWNDEILIHKRVKDDIYAVPGGKPHEDENILTTAKRELKEETGLDLEVEKMMFVDLTTKYQGKHYITVYFQFIYDPDQEIQNLEPEKHEDLKWVNVRDLPVLFHDSHKHIPQFFN